MANYLLSKLMSVVIDSSTVGCATDFSVSVNKDLIEVACLNSGAAKESIPDMYGWKVSGSGLVFKTVGQTGYSAFNIASSMTTDASVYVKLLPDVSLNQYFAGVGYFSSLSMDGGVGAPVKYSFEITGTGALSVLTTS